ncbi:putative bifunctional diguanylate cyclase/phosphodiesterase [Kaarinaea lacus]
MSRQLMSFCCVYFFNYRFQYTLKLNILNSLRSRYILFASLLAVLVIIVSFFGYRNVSVITKETTNNIETRRQLLDHISRIRISVFDGYKSLDAFLLDPTRKETKQQIHDSLHMAIGLSQELLAFEWITDQELAGSVNDLIASFKMLDEEVENLMQVRTDPTRQYPSLELGNNVMQPNRNNLNNAIALVLDDPVTKNKLLETPELYGIFINLRHLWSQTLSNFRMYLANRVGSFSEESLPIQEKAIETMFQELEIYFQKLHKFDDSGKLTFEVSAALEDMESSARGWYQGYLDVKEIHHSDAWRADTKFIKDTIEPRLNEIDKLLVILDKAIESSGNRDVQALTQVAKLQTTILQIITGFGLAFILLNIFSLQRLVFHPIDSVARALKAEAFGKNGVLLPTVRTRETQNLIDAFSEMRKQVHSRQADLEHQALHDALTDLPNRTLLHDRMEQAINVARREHKNLTLLMIDLDRFKEINDTLGHHVGDNVLKEVGLRLLGTLRQIDTVARLGGDEYAILLPDTDIADAETITKKIVSALDDVFEIDELNLFIKASIGLAEYPTHGKDAAALIQHADVAMYVAKRGQLGVAVYDPKDDDHSIGRLALISDLRQALENNLLQLYYQPKLDLATGDIIGVEALLRWNHERYGAIPPDQIVTLSEQTGMIDDVTKWVLEETIRQINEWQQQNLQINVSINLSMYNLKNPELIPFIQSLFNNSRARPQDITLEITESAMMANPKRSLKSLLEISDMGIRLSIDDFGTGFSSLAYLKKLPVDELKIDKSFVMDIIHDENDFTIVKSTIDLAHNLGVEVIAEGVERQEVYDALKKMECDAVQGFFISYPLEAGKLLEFINRKHPVKEEKIS